MITTFFVLFNRPFYEKKYKRVSLIYSVLFVFIHSMCKAFSIDFRMHFELLHACKECFIQSNINCNENEKIKFYFYYFQKD